jgi:hypothetical protein
VPQTAWRPLTVVSLVARLVDHAHFLEQVIGVLRAANRVLLVEKDLRGDTTAIAARNSEGQTQSVFAHALLAVSRPRGHYVQFSLTSTYFPKRDELLLRIVLACSNQCQRTNSSTQSEQEQ